jgi:DNA-binding NarL/FixJ family response regulator
MRPPVADHGAGRSAVFGLAVSPRGWRRWSRPLDLEVFYNGMLVIRDPTVVAGLTSLHRGWWGSGADPAAGREPSEPPPHLAPVLACMGDGLPDHAAAARLGLSPRTYTRRVSELLALLDTTNRFHAGAVAARRGWI